MIKVLTCEASESVFAFPVAIHESGDKLGQLLMVLGFGDEAVPGATHTLAAAQGAGCEVVEDKCSRTIQFIRAQVQ
jgi:siroheme synthase